MKADIPDPGVTPLDPPGQLMIAMSDQSAVLEFDHPVIPIRAHQGQSLWEIEPIDPQEAMKIDHAAKPDTQDRETTPLGLSGQLPIGREMGVPLVRAIAMTDLVVIRIRVHQGQGLREIEPIDPQGVMKTDHAARVTLIGVPGQLVIGQGMIVLAARVIDLIDLQEITRTDHAEIRIRVRQGQSLREIEPIDPQEVMEIDHAVRVDIPDQRATPLDLPGQLVIVMSDQSAVLKTDLAVIPTLVHRGQGLRQIEPIVQPEIPKIDRAAKLDIPDQEVTPLGLPGQPVIGQRMNVRGAMVTRGPLGLPIKDPPGQMVRSQ